MGRSIYLRVPMVSATKRAVERRVRALTQRQRSVLHYVAQGYGTKEIAARLGISVNGVKKHVESLLRRYDVNNRPALVTAALAAGDVEIYRALAGLSPRARTPRARRVRSRAVAERS